MPAPLDRGTSAPYAVDAPSAAEPARATDSPWLWLLLFAAVGLLALWGASGKYAQRQADLERRFFAFQEMQRRTAESEPRTPRAAEIDPDTVPLIITLRPLYLTLGLIAAGAWVALAWQQRAARRAADLLDEPPFIPSERP